VRSPDSKFTLLFERLAIDWLGEAAVTAVARQLKLGWDAVWGIERRAVTRGLERRGTLTLRSLRSDRRRGRRAQDGIGADTPFEGPIFRAAKHDADGRCNRALTRPRGHPPTELAPPIARGGGRALHRRCLRASPAHLLRRDSGVTPTTRDPP